MVVVGGGSCRGIVPLYHTCPLHTPPVALYNGIGPYTAHGHMLLMAYWALAYTSPLAYYAPLMAYTQPIKYLR